jgi:hypothetical protein
MKRACAALLALALTAPIGADGQAPRSFAATGSIELAFTPADRIDRLIIATIDAAQYEVVVLADSPHATTLTGSYDYTLAAQRNNAQNVIVLRDNPQVARAYRDNWARRHASAEAFVQTPHP